MIKAHTETLEECFALIYSNCFTKHNHRVQVVHGVHLCILLPHVFSLIPACLDIMFFVGFVSVIYLYDVVMNPKASHVDTGSHINTLQLKLYPWGETSCRF